MIVGLNLFSLWLGRLLGRTVVDRMRFHDTGARLHVLYVLRVGSRPAVEAVRLLGRNVQYDARVAEERNAGRSVNLSARAG